MPNSAPMIILNIETSTGACSAALTQEGEVMVINGRRMSALIPEKSEHARQLAVMVDDLLAGLRSEGLSPDAIAVSAGPGSYTGLRIGASMAKGLSYGLNVPLLAIPTLQIMASAALSAINEIDSTALLCPMIDARRMEVYDQLFDTNLVTRSEVEARVVDAEAFLNELEQGSIYFFGDGAGKCQSVIGHSNAHFIENICPDAASMGTLAEEAYRNKQFADVAYWTPFYLKEFEAKKSVIKGLN